jgi:aryl-alcohol dehydrogenase-like predicted oxidoreductase
MPAENRPPWFSRWSDLLNRWDKLSVDSGWSPAALALNFALNEKGIERVVVGVESHEQLAQHLGTKKILIENTLDELACDDANLIEPYRWKLK